MTDHDFRTADAQDEAQTAADRDESATGPDAGPVDEEAMQRAEGLTASPEVAEHYQEMAEKGANAEGEGRVP